MGIPCSNCDRLNTDNNAALKFMCTAPFCTAKTVYAKVRASLGGHGSFAYNLDYFIAIVYGRYTLTDRQVEATVHYLTSQAKLQCQTKQELLRTSF